MAPRKLPCSSVLRQLLTYNPDTGLFIWNERPVDFFSASNCHTARHTCLVWNTKHAGKPAFAGKDPKGYLRGSLLGQMMLAHRVAFAIHHGECPDVIDHIDCDPANNAISNLREASVMENTRNSPARGGSSRFKGVSFCKRDKVFVSHIGVDYAKIRLGCFKSEVAAAKAYDVAALKHHGEFARLNFPQAHADAAYWAQSKIGGE